ncbi:hypothetical protein Q8F55_001828 [Vanrija albida]|uniref:Uncharacterized protein n=1 Tax=Vanrija albida TaxID=181172 RepID=A0ABR3Q8B9_9TREE
MPAPAPEPEPRMTVRAALDAHHPGANATLEGLIDLVVAQRDADPALSPQLVGALIFVTARVTAIGGARAAAILDRVVGAACDEPSAAPSAPPFSFGDHFPTAPPPSPDCEQDSSLGGDVNGGAA